MDCWTETSQPLLEGNIKYRDNKQWKSRWAIITKPSPIADCLKVIMFKNFKEKFKKNLAPKTMVELENYLGMESGFTFDKESNTMAIICVNQTIVVAFETREILLQWQSRLQEHFCKEAHFLVHVMSVVPKNNRTLCGPHRLLLQDWNFCLVSGIPPRLSFHWPIKQLRRFGIVEGKFCFEGGSQCGKGAGLHVLYTSQPEQLARYFELASNGQLNSLISNGNTESQDVESAHTRLRSINSGESDSGDSRCQLLSSTDDVLDSVSNYCLDSVDCHYHSSINLNQKSFNQRLDVCSSNRCSYSSNTISRFSSLACQKIDKNNWKVIKNHPRGRSEREGHVENDNCESIPWNNDCKVLQNNSHQDELNSNVDFQGSGTNSKDPISKNSVIVLNDFMKNYDIPRKVCKVELNGTHAGNQKLLDKERNEGPANDCICQLYNGLDQVDSRVCGCNNISLPQCHTLDQEFIDSSAKETMAQEWSSCGTHRSYGCNDISQSDKSNPETIRTKQSAESNFGYENMYFLNTMQLYENMCFSRQNPNDIHAKLVEGREEVFSKDALLKDSLDRTSLSLSKSGKEQMGVEDYGAVKQDETGHNESQNVEDDCNVQERTTASLEKLKISSFQDEADTCS